MRIARYIDLTFDYSDHDPLCGIHDFESIFWANVDGVSDWKPSACVPLYVPDGGFFEHIDCRMLADVGVVQTWLAAHKMRAVYWSAFRDTAIYAPWWAAPVCRWMLLLRDWSAQQWNRFYRWTHPDHPACTMIPWPSWAKWGW